MDVSFQKKDPSDELTASSSFSPPPAPPGGGAIAIISIKTDQIQETMSTKDSISRRIAQAASVIFSRFRI